MNQSHPIGGGLATKYIHSTWCHEHLRGGEESVNEYMFWFWRPMGNLPDLEVWQFFLFFFCDLEVGETNRPVSQLFFMTFVWVSTDSEYGVNGWKPRGPTMTRALQNISHADRP